MVDEAVERLLAYHGRRYWLGNGWSVRFRVWRTEVTDQKPHGLRYAFTLHDVDGTRLLGFDNAHGVGREIEFDHEHRFGRVRHPVPYRFVDADSLLVAFFARVERACETVGVSMEIVFEDLDPGLGREEDDADVA